MKNKFTILSISAMLVGGALLVQTKLWSQSNWASFGQDQGASRFSKLTQINATNVQKLEKAWTFHTGATAQNEMTPLVIDSVMYLSASNGYYAVDAVTGTQLWKYDATGTTERGISYWAGDTKASARIIGSVAGNKLVALNAKTGKPIPGFGVEGFLDIGSGMQSPPSIYKEMMIVPSRDRTVKAWSIRTGEAIWSFNLVPQPGEPGHDSWKNDAWQTTRGVDVWGHITVDATLGIAFVPTAPPSPDYVGISRPGDTLYGTSLIALDANTGKLKWYHQLVHHDLWDMDSAAAPTLFEATVKGVKIPAVAHMAKTGLMYMYDRRDGKPLFGEEERPVPQSNVPGEMSSPTQPFPVKPEPIARVSMKMSDIPKNVTPELAAYCQGLVDKYKLGDAQAYNAWLLNQDVVEFPGALGGGNWGGSSYNPALGLIITNVQNVGQWGHIQVGGRGGPGGPGGGRGGSGGRGGFPGGGRGGPGGAFGASGDPGGRGRGARGGPPAGAAGASGAVTYGKNTPEGQRFWQPDTRYSCAPTPWGELVAVNVNTGNIAWRATLGQFDELTAKGIPSTGAPNAGGSITTAGNLVFIGATVDSRFRAFDARNGKELWSVVIDAPAHSIPATYMGKDGRQYVVVSAAGGGFLRDKTSDSVVAFALPKTK